MEYLLLNKNKKLFTFNYNENTKMFDSISEIYDIDFLPLFLSKYSKDELLVNFLEWLNDRFQRNSNWYKKQTLRHPEIQLTNSIIVKSYGLSLSDQYWIKPVSDKSFWENVNFFDNDFYLIFLRI